jgi:hypothetical protein
MVEFPKMIYRPRTEPNNDLGGMKLDSLVVNSPAEQVAATRQGWKVELADAVALVEARDRRNDRIHAVRRWYERWEWSFKAIGPTRPCHGCDSAFEGRLSQANGTENGMNDSASSLTNIDLTLDIHQSVYRERLLEHLLVGELLKYSWLHAGATLEVSQPSIDRSGHDVVLEANGVTRHLQLKSSSHVAQTPAQKVHLGVAKKPSGCVVWTRFDRSTMNLGPFLFFGGEPSLPLPPLDAFKVAKHTKGNNDGIKKERPNLRVVRMSQFREIADIPALYVALFGNRVLDPEPTVSR